MLQAILNRFLSKGFVLQFDKKKTVTYSDNELFWKKIKPFRVKRKIESLFEKLNYKALKLYQCQLNVISFIILHLCF